MDASVQSLRPCQIMSLMLSYHKHTFHAYLPELPVAFSYSGPIKICSQGCWWELKIPFFIYQEKQRSITRFRFSSILISTPVLKHSASASLYYSENVTSDKSLLTYVYKRMMQSVKKRTLIIMSSDTPIDHHETNHAQSATA